MPARFLETTHSGLLAVLSGYAETIVDPIIIGGCNHRPIDIIGRWEPLVKVSFIEGEEFMGHLVN